MAKLHKSKVFQSRKVPPRRVHDINIVGGLAKPRVTLRHLARLTPKNIVLNATGCNVRPTKLEMNLNDIGVYKLVRANILCDVVVHNATIQMYTHLGTLPTTPDELAELMQIPKGAPLWNAPTWVSCDCEYFMFNCEVANHRQQAADIIFSNGEFPSMTNAQMIPHLCKHLYSLAPIAVTMSKSPTGKRAKRKDHPPHRGQLPKSLKEMFTKKEKTPTEEEVSHALLNVRDFL